MTNRGLQIETVLRKAVSLFASKSEFNFLLLNCYKQGEKLPMVVRLIHQNAGVYVRVIAEGETDNLLKWPEESRFSVQNSGECRTIYISDGTAIDRVRDLCEELTVLRSLRGALDKHLLR